MFSAVLLCFVLLGCATRSGFRGMGELRGPGFEAPPLDSPFVESADGDTPEEAGEEDESGTPMPEPERTWKGERKIAPGGVIAFEWPVKSVHLSQPFRQSGGRSHWGVDLGGPKGTPILAAERGYVIYTGKGFRGYGNLIVIEHNEEWATLYSHLHRIEVREGQYVNRGERIGTMGRTGRASGVHLHFEIRHKRQPVNPEAYLPPAPVSSAPLKKRKAKPS